MRKTALYLLIAICAGGIAPVCAGEPPVAPPIPKPTKPQTKAPSPAPTPAPSGKVQKSSEKKTHNTEKKGKNN